MACGPVDRRANRAEWARATKSPHGPVRTGWPVRPGLLTVGPPGRKKIQNFEIKCLETQNVCLKVI